MCLGGMMEERLQSRLTADLLNYDFNAVTLITCSSSNHQMQFMADQAPEHFSFLWRLSRYLMPSPSLPQAFYFPLFTLQMEKCCVPVWFFFFPLAMFSGNGGKGDANTHSWTKTPFPVVLRPSQEICVALSSFSLCHFNIFLEQWRRQTKE